VITQRRREAKPQRVYPMHENELSEAIIGAAIEVHTVLGGPGLLEDVHEESQRLCVEVGLGMRADNGNRISG